MTENELQEKINAQGRSLLIYERWLEVQSVRHQAEMAATSARWEALRTRKDGEIESLRRENDTFVSKNLHDECMLAKYQVNLSYTQKKLNTCMSELDLCRAELAAATAELESERARSAVLEVALGDNSDISDEARSKRCRISSGMREHPMEKRTVISVVLTFTGPKQWLFIAGINRLWRGMYMKLERKMRTGFQAAVTSIPRINLSVSAGMNLNMMCTKDGYKEFHLGAYLGRHASKDIILHCKAKGMDWEGNICRGAASAGRLLLLKELYREYSCPLGKKIGSSAAKAPSTETLTWLKDEVLTEMWSDDCLEEMLESAAESGRVENARWLREHGARWSRTIMYVAACNSQVRFMQWATSRGCPITDNGETFVCEIVKHSSYADTTEALAWLHAQDGLRCTCNFE